MSRAALSQGTSVYELQKFFGLPAHGDPDLSWSEQLLARISTQCQLPAEDFRFAMRMFASIEKIDPCGQRFLLKEKRKAIYRYCPVCLHQLRVKHFMVHWRFSVWRYCPLHDCMMEDSCSKCGQKIQLPTDMLTGRGEKMGIPCLGQCSGCGHRLSAHWKHAMSTVTRSTTSEWEWAQLSRGRTFLSAIYHGSFNYAKAYANDQGLEELLQLERSGLLPNRNLALSVEEVERRKLSR